MPTVETHFECESCEINGDYCVGFTTCGDVITLYCPFCGEGQEHAFYDFMYAA